ncbi:hypothetical protein ACLESO_51050 [Pyxidicoccus sp. 3LG]
MSWTLMLTRPLASWKGWPFTSKSRPTSRPVRSMAPRLRSAKVTRGAFSVASTTGTSAVPDTTPSITIVPWMPICSASSGPTTSASDRPSPPKR